MHEATRAERRAARERVSRYYETELAKLIDRVEQAIDRYRDGEIGLHDVDDVIHRYSKAARELWKFCWSTGSLQAFTGVTFGVLVAMRLGI